MAKPNWMKSVTTTPQSPERVLYTPTIAKSAARIDQSLPPPAASVPESTVNFRTFSIAAATQPTMIEFTRSAM